MRTGGGVHLFGVQAEGRRECDEGGEPLGRFGNAARLGECLYEPERARQERAFGAGQSVAAGRIAVEEGAASVEVARDRVDGVVEAWRLGGLDGEGGEGQHRGGQGRGGVAGAYSTA